MVGRNKFFKVVILCFSFVFCFFMFVGCRDFSKYYWDYNCNWVSENPKIVLYQGARNGEMTIDNIHYEFYTRRANNAKYIYFYIVKNDDFESKTYLWKADTTLKDNKLYLKITEDYISDYQGKILVLEQKCLQ